MEIRAAALDEVGAYVVFAQAAQQRLRSRGLGQYIPAAHDEYAAAVREKAAGGSLYAVVDEGAILGFFGLDAGPSPWWPADIEPALYLTGMVVNPQANRRGVGVSILRWCAGEARRRGISYVRLDCHADNSWLRSYYERHGFALVRQIDQRPDYRGCLYQLAVD